MFTGVRLLVLLALLMLLVRVVAGVRELLLVLLGVQVRVLGEMEGLLLLWVEVVQGGGSGVG
jgi:hypothetical protein